MLKPYYQSNIDNRNKIVNTLYFGIGSFYFLGAVFLNNFDAILIISAYVFGFFIGWKLFDNKGHSAVRGQYLSLTYLRKQDQIIFIAYIVTLSVYIYKLNFYGLFSKSIGSRSNMALLTRGDLLFSVLDEILLTIFIYHTALLAYYGLKRSWYYQCSFIITIIVGVHSISLSYFAAVMIAQLFFIDKNIPVTKYIILFMIPGLLISCFWKPVAGWILLGNNSFSFNDINYPGEFINWVTVYENITDSKDYWKSSKFGTSYVMTTLSVLYPFLDIEPLSVDYAFSYETSIYLSGGGRGFPFFLEAYINFGLLGVFISGVVVALLFNMIAMRSTKSVMMLFIYITFCSVIFKFFRSESYSIFKNLIWIQLYPILLLKLGIYIILKVIHQKAS
jgi:oligosaccharide repeat unit polymerase